MPRHPSSRRRGPSRPAARGLPPPCAADPAAAPRPRSPSLRRRRSGCGPNQRARQFPARAAHFRAASAGKCRARRSAPSKRGRMPGAQPRQRRQWSPTRAATARRRACGEVLVAVPPAPRAGRPPRSGPEAQPRPRTPPHHSQLHRPHPHQRARPGRHSRPRMPRSRQRPTPQRPRRRHPRHRPRRRPVATRHRPRRGAARGAGSTRTSPWAVSPSWRRAPRSVAERPGTHRRRCRSRRCRRWVRRRLY